MCRHSAYGHSAQWKHLSFPPSCFEFLPPHFGHCSSICLKVLLIFFFPITSNLPLGMADNRQHGVIDRCGTCNITQQTSCRHFIHRQRSCRIGSDKIICQLITANSFICLGGSCTISSLRQMCAPFITVVGADDAISRRFFGGLPLRFTPSWSAAMARFNLSRSWIKSVRICSVGIKPMVASFSPEISFVGCGAMNDRTLVHYDLEAEELGADQVLPTERCYYRDIE